MGIFKKDKMTNEEAQAALTAAQELLKPKNAVTVIMRVDGNVFVKSIKIVDVPNLEVDDHIGSVGFELGQAFELLSGHMIEHFNELVRRKR